MNVFLFPTIHLHGYPLVNILYVQKTMENQHLSWVVINELSMAIFTSKPLVYQRAINFIRTISQAISFDDHLDHHIYEIAIIWGLPSYIMGITISEPSIIWGYP